MVWSKSKITYFLIIIAIIIFLYFFFPVKAGETLQFDRVITDYITSIFKESSYSFFKLFNIIGSTKGIGVISLIVIAFLWKRNRDYMGIAIFAFAMAFGDLLNIWVKNYVGRPRPSEEHLVHVKSLSFPSGHAMMGIILYILIAYFIMAGLKSKGLKWLTVILAVIMILLMGISRIVLQVHYPSDIAAGFSLGLVWVLIWIIVYELLRKRY
ncbi:phosphatase PAP2 family protein [Bacillus sp. S/N-304-OC-R1]|uniref:phosphatase PAP2 family protein n=1 Tax=Bacillus sp. S/N-304-OC-R1 TaxID=2758034 RepID=UPI001C8DABB5|nr:phosphatase PAP2 family protein [Bacillus sp. S/N-304-OC-R1]MBY0121119.1 phosphatase PAP2 family protein [Bacillus sp. S/N-304-OC-R1]